MWVEEEVDAPEIESWRHFRHRIARGIEAIRGMTGKNARIAVFTSGGAIGASVGLALELTPQKTLEVSWTSRNASYTEFLFSSERLSLASFNNHPHLDQPELLTYR